MKDIMLRIDNVSKQYKLGQIGGTTLRDELQRRRAKRQGKEDPTKIIGTKDYNAGEIFMALDGISFDVKKSERVGIIGHNGAGKSTLLKLISRVTAPTSGMIGLNGRVASMLEVGTGFHGELTGRENIYMNGAILGMTKKEIDSKIEDIIDFSEVRQFIDTPVKRYSSGMYVKLAFSVAAHLDSEIMIMDEVLAVGDMAFQKKCLNKMSDVSKNEGRTILYVSHNMHTIRQLCDRVIVLEKGRVSYDGEVESGIQTYMNSRELGYSKYYDLSNALRHGYPSGKIKIMSVEIKNEIPLVMGDKLRIIIKWLKDQLQDNKVIFRFLIGKPSGLIGMTMSDYIDVEKGDNLTAEIDTSMLATGKYYVNIEIINMENKKQVFLESVKACQFEIIDNTRLLQNFNWYKPWGFVSFPKPKCY